MCTHGNKKASVTIANQAKETTYEKTSKASSRLQCAYCRSKALGVFHHGVQPTQKQTL